MGGRRAAAGVSQLPAALCAGAGIVDRCPDDMSAGDFHLRHRRRGMFAFDSRRAAGEKLLRAQRAHHYVFVCAELRRASNHYEPLLMSW